MHRSKRTILTSLVLGVAVAALAAPAALGEPRGPGNTQERADFWNYDARTGEKVADTSPGLAPADLSGVYGVGSSAGSYDRALYRGSDPVGSQLDPLIGDAIRASQNSVSSPDDRKFSRSVETPNVPVSVTVTSDSDGIQWSDAGLGAASTLAIVLLMGGATLLIRHQRRRIAAF